MIHSIRIKAITSISIILGCAFIFLGVYNYQTSRQAIKDEIVNSSMPLLRENIYSEIKRQFVPALNVASVMSHDSFLINWITDGEKDVPKIIQFLKKIQSEYGYFSTFLVSAKTGRYYHFSGVHKILHKDDKHDVWYYDFVSSGKKYALDVDYDEAGNNQLTIFINYRVHDFNGNLIGVTGVGIKMMSFSQFLANQQENYKRKIYLVNRQGVIQAHSDIRSVEQININDTPGIKTIADDILSNFVIPLMTQYVIKDQTIIVSSKYIDELDWFLIVEQNESEAMGSVHGNLIRTLIVGSLSLLIILLIAIAVVNHFNKQLEIQASTDPLTLASNRREFSNQLQFILNRFQKNKTALSLIMIDIDNFKDINDTWGHQTGDYVLQETVRRITLQKRDIDIVSRLGGDEFAVLVKAPLAIAESVAERILKAIGEHPYISDHNTQVTVTMSIGVYEMSMDDTPEDMLHNADQAMYRAKNNGKNCIKL